jgi:cholest-4-en-3-one 26-monooxygenase
MTDEIHDLKLMDADLFGDGPPHDLFRRMRDEAPVRWDPGGFWSVTRDDDVAAVSRDFETFSNYEGGIFLNPDLVNPLDVNRNLLLFKDPPEHTKYRKILQTAFVPNSVRKLEPQVRALITRTIDAVIEAGECDFVADIAVPIPLGVLAELMGLPEADIPKLKRWTDEIEQAQISTESAAALPTLGEMSAYLMEQLGAQAEAGADSLVTTLRAAEVDGQRLSDMEILVFFALLVFAGNDTTRNTASSGTLALLEHPEQWRMLCEQPELIPQAVEEILRYTTVVNYFARTATRDTELGGQRITKGDKVVMWYASASRDERVCPHPQQFDIGRAEISHRAFGGGGRHFCLGAGLARLELQVLFEELTRRMPDLRPAGPVTRLRSSWANALTAMPVSFSAGVREAAGAEEVSAT